MVVPEGVPQPEADLDLVHGELGLVEHLRRESDSVDSGVKRRLSECSRRFHNHGDGPY